MSIMALALPFLIIVLLIIFLTIVPVGLWIRARASGVPYPPHAHLRPAFRLRSLRRPARGH